MRSALVLALAASLIGPAWPARAVDGGPATLDAAALQAHAARPWDKAAMAHRTVEWGLYQGVPVVAEHPCADVCPQYTVRIVHYRLPPGARCADVGGVEKRVLVPVAITVLPKTFCIPQPLLASDAYYAR